MTREFSNGHPQSLPACKFVFSAIFIIFSCKRRAVFSSYFEAAKTGSSVGFFAFWSARFPLQPPQGIVGDLFGGVFECDRRRSIVLSLFITLYCVHKNTQDLSEIGILPLGHQWVCSLTNWRCIYLFYGAKILGIFKVVWFSLICFLYKKCLNFQTGNPRFSVLDAWKFAMGRRCDSTISFFMPIAWFAWVCIRSTRIFLKLNFCRAFRVSRVTSIHSAQKFAWLKFMSYFCLYLWPTVPVKVGY